MLHKYNICLASNDPDFAIGVYDNLAHFHTGRDDASYHPGDVALSEFGNSARHFHFISRGSFTADRLD
jgi:hypothetical protein